MCSSHDIFIPESTKTISAGRILFVDADCLIKSIGYRLYRSVDKGSTWKFVFQFDVSWWCLWIVRIPLVRRFLRKGVYKLLQQPNGGYAVFVDKFIYGLNAQFDKSTVLGRIKGSRPLYPCIHENQLYYGEYGRNSERKPVSIHRCHLDTGVWSKAHEFHDIRHIHGIFSDPYTGRLWITTGDLDNECRIMYSEDDLGSCKVCFAGAQKYRTIYLHFTEHSIIFGTDAPDEKNHAYEYSRDPIQVVGKTPVGGPVFYGAANPEMQILTTAVEPSKINEQNYAELWVKKVDKPWIKLLKIKKDRWPKKLLYGQILLPSGAGCEGILVFTPVASEYKEKVIILDTKSLRLSNS